MSTPHLYQPAKLHTGLELILTPEVSKHLMQVLRWPLNEPFRLFNGEGGEYQAKIIKSEKKQTIAHIGQFYPENLSSPVEIHLGQGISRGEKMDFTIQKAVELGVTHVTPLLTERCNVKLPADRWEKRVQHWRSVAIAACEQSGRNILPVILEPQSPLEWVNRLTVDLKLMLDPTGSQQLKDLSVSPNSIALLIGSEGGLSVNEQKLAKQQNFIGLNLGPRILRTETAAIAAIAVIQSTFGDMG